jgi:hypothetical protein
MFEASANYHSKVNEPRFWILEFWNKIGFEEEGAQKFRCFIAKRISSKSHLLFHSSALTSTATEGSTDTTALVQKLPLFRTKKLNSFSRSFLLLSCSSFGQQYLPRYTRHHLALILFSVTHAFNALPRLKKEVECQALTVTNQLLLRLLLLPRLVPHVSSHPHHYCASLAYLKH